MRPIWKGAISFGMVTMPVKLYTATEQKDIRFRLLHKTDGAPIEGRQANRQAAPGIAEGHRPDGRPEGERRQVEGQHGEKPARKRAAKRTAA
jgi:hypothetical protein